MEEKGQCPVRWGSVANVCECVERRRRGRFSFCVPFSIEHADGVNIVPAVDPDLKKRSRQVAEWFSIGKFLSSERKLLINYPKRQKSFSFLRLVPCVYKISIKIYGTLAASPFLLSPFQELSRQISFLRTNSRRNCFGCLKEEFITSAIRFSNQKPKNFSTRLFRDSIFRMVNSLENYIRSVISPSSPLLSRSNFWVNYN